MDYSKRSTSLDLEYSRSPQSTLIQRVDYVKTKNILIGGLVSLFCIGLISTGFAEDNEYNYASFGDKDSYNTMGQDGIESAYSPMTVSRGIASSSQNNDSKVIEFDYSPRENSNLASVPSTYKNNEDIQFDYSPRPLNCGTHYC